MIINYFVNLIIEIQMGIITYNWFNTPSTKEGQKRYHVRTANNSRMSFEEVCKALEMSTTATMADVRGIIEGISQLISNRLSNGSSVHLEGLGYFSVAITAPSFNDPAEINGRNIKVQSVDFKPDKCLIKKIKKDVKFQKVSHSERSVTLSKYAVERLLNDFLEKHDCITANEFRILLNQTRATAYRRLKELCSGTRPLLLHMGGRQSSVYVMNPNR